MPTPRRSSPRVTPIAAETSAVVCAVVCDPSALVAALAGSIADGDWAAGRLGGATLVAPCHLPWETANALRRLELAGKISPDLAVQAHEDLLDLAVELWPHDLVAARAWDLRHDLTIYEAGYVALAERLEATLVTLDRRLAAAPGLLCAVQTP